ncbi:hypothetical protein DTO013E5_6572 [Penicillium roqueforti]|uniref:uncharacterized protein n=1 Tax=Penicillium roqueforti TaxID=5082 RepID=UPI00190BE125|nr:uncharacterized protein LCP9604111_6764 [Penicillium roqueforti]KAF9246092.1 hypothetical protein LCP9604111_6764 [Penicillium roqueforti]KAI2686042.1 hypothetical protein CBS147355_1529 [Penicillium roqueforti]KAI2731444.1 hypothetical protein CBS147354_553 [Penicillium roqueforti]KAI2735002.1 hypothetical protein DTO012A1_9545 [Penicillium roqueforti]KAI2755606.1 hypothetical protein DTO013F2_1289 [Penicillium roqueforti]
MTDISQIFKGTQIALPGSADLQLNASTWVIDEKLYENRVDGVREPTSDPDEQPSGWEAKYLCHDQHFPNNHAFMRVYCQGPDEGTEFLLPEVRAQQANPHFEKREAKARKKFSQGGCKSVPSLLGYGQSTQGENGPVPGGYITYLVWEKVPGQVLTPELFWSFERPKRDLVRRKFRAAYEDMSSFGWGPGGGDITKIIWDKECADLWISAFRASYPTDDKWGDRILAYFNLIEPPPRDVWGNICEDLDKWEW